ncbi:MAG: hypothetical protein ACKPKO_26600, partial [Candidatus Fonsibacter sp.]
LLTRIPREEDVMQDFFNDLCDMFGVKYNDFWVTYHGRKCEPQTLAYSLPHAAWMSINFRCHGGGKRAHNTKTTGEESLPTSSPFKENAKDFVKDTDAKLFESVFSTATDTRAVVVDDLLNAMNIETLKEMNTVLASGGKTNHLLKIKMVVDSMPFIKDMVTARDKLSNSIDLTKTNIAAAIWEHVCIQSDDKQFDMTILKNKRIRLYQSKKALLCEIEQDLTDAHN